MEADLAIDQLPETNTKRSQIVIDVTFIALSLESPSTQLLGPLAQSQKRDYAGEQNILTILIHPPKNVDCTLFG